MADGGMLDGDVGALLLRAEACLVAAHARLAPARPLLAATLHEELDLVRTIRLSLDGPASTAGQLDAWVPLSVSERQYALRVARGLTTAAIARDLAVAPSTARRRLRRILLKLELDRPLQLAAWVLSDSRRRIAAGSVEVRDRSSV